MFTKHIVITKAKNIYKQSSVNAQIFARKILSFLKNSLFLDYLFKNLIETLGLIFKRDWFKVQIIQLYCYTY